MRTSWSGCLVIAIMLAGCFDSYGSDHQDLRREEFFASDYQQAIHWDGLDIDVILHAKPGYAPGERTRAALIEQLGAAFPAKDVRLVDVEEPGPADADRVWQPNELYEISKAWQKEPWPKGRALIHVGYWDGCYRLNDERQCIRGVAHPEVAWVLRDANLVALSEDPDTTIFRPFPPPIDPLEERYLTIHEVGHVIGLVDSGVPQVIERATDDCRCHSDRDDSVMSGTGAGGSIQIPIDEGINGILEPIINDDLEVHWFSEEDLQDFAAFRELGGQVVTAGLWDYQEYWLSRQ